MDPTALSPLNGLITPTLGRPSLAIRIVLGAAALLALLSCSVTTRCRCHASELRRTAIVKAVQKSRPSIVNIRGQKTVRGGDPAAGHGDGPRQVNGMGTGVVLDPRGYIITNFHVIDGVSTINVTLANGDHFVARHVSHDPGTDLAIIKIDTQGEPIPVIQIGTSDDLMPGEPVIAVGNAYGYENTVTRGIISALHRTVQVSDVQNYHDLIQTDASINPGNSGGPLLNIDGEMIGINVAVRVGAQGIGFALPIDKVLEISAELISVRRLENKWHGIVAPATEGQQGGLVVEQVEAGSPAERTGLRRGDVIRHVDNHRIRRLFDLEAAFLENNRDDIQLEVERGGELVDLDFVLTSAGNPPKTRSQGAWQVLGLKLKPISANQIRDKQSRYRGGLAVTAVRSNSPAAEQGIRPGDILVGMHIWETVSLDNLTYVLKQDDLTSDGPIKFYILRGEQTLFGHLRVASHHRSQLSRN